MKTTRELRRELFPDLTVLTGPFRGMKYPSPRSFGSSLLPKLLGSYESELHQTLKEMLSNRYTAIVNVGCGEGFYAVGLGLKFPKADVFAFDVAAKARELCCALGKLNGIDRRLTISERCDRATLRSVLSGRKALIVCDCEGCEDGLFTSESSGFLVGHDLIVEVHDFIKIDVSLRMRKVFDKTHRIRSIKSVHDSDKGFIYKQQLERYDETTRRLIVAERRPAIMEWLVMTTLADVDKCAIGMSKQEGHLRS